MEGKGAAADLLARVRVVDVLWGHHPLLERLFGGGWKVAVLPGLAPPHGGPPGGAAAPGANAEAATLVVPAGRGGCGDGGGVHVRGGLAALGHLCADHGAPAQRMARRRAPHGIRHLFVAAGLQNRVVVGQTGLVHCLRRVRVREPRCFARGRKRAGVDLADELCDVDAGHGAGHGPAQAEGEGVVGVVEGRRGVLSRDGGGGGCRRRDGLSLKGGMERERRDGEHGA